MSLFKSVSGIAITACRASRPTMIATARSGTRWTTTFASASGVASRRSMSAAAAVQDEMIDTFPQYGRTEARLKELGIVLPKVTPPKGSYVLAQRNGNMIFTAGHLPVREDGSLITGRVGSDLTADEGKEAARRTAINLIATLKHELGELDRVKQITKVFGLVQCSDDFTQHPYVINGFSDTMFEVFGERGVHARSAVGTNSLPLGIAVEIEAMVQIDDSL